MKKIKLLSMALFVFTITLCLNNVQAANTITVGAEGQNYTTLEEAVKYVGEGDTIKLMSDINVFSCIEVTSGTYSIDLNGYKITHAEDGNTFLNVAEGRVTIKDTSANKSGIVESLSDSFTFTITGGNLIIDGGNYRTKAKISEFALIQKGKITINEANIEVPIGMEIKGGSTIINDVYIKSCNCIWVAHDSINEESLDIVINGGKFIVPEEESTSIMWICAGNKTNITINNGNFESKNGSVITEYVEMVEQKYDSNDYKDFNLLIKGGIFKGGAEALQLVCRKPIIQGGTFITTSNETGAISLYRGASKEHIAADYINNKDINVLNLVKEGYTFTNITTKEVATKWTIEDEDGEDEEIGLKYFHTINAKEVKVIPDTQNQKLYVEDGTTYIEGKFTGVPVFTTTKIGKGNTAYDNLTKLISEERKEISAYELKIDGGTFTGKAIVKFLVDVPDGTKIIVNHLLKNGKVENTFCTVKNKMVEVEVTELSPFIISEDLAKPVEKKKDISPETGIEENIVPIVLIAYMVTAIEIYINKIKIKTK